MLQLNAQQQLFIAIEPIDFGWRKNDFHAVASLGGLRALQRSSNYQPQPCKYSWHKVVLRRLIHRVTGGLFIMLLDEIYLERLGNTKVLSLPSAFTLSTALVLGWYFLAMRLK